jgi:hypothetical protein
MRALLLGHNSTRCHWIKLPKIRGMSRGELDFRMELLWTIKRCWPALTGFVFSPTFIYSWTSVSFLAIWDMATAAECYLHYIYINTMLSLYCTFLQTSCKKGDTWTFYNYWKCRVTLFCTIVTLNSTIIYHLIVPLCLVLSQDYR